MATLDDGTGMDRLGTLLGETRARLLELLRDGPRSIGDLAGALGISENAVRTHVAAAERDGLVEQAGRQRSTGGKPARLYGLTRAAEELYPKAYALVFTELVGTLRDEEGEEAAVALLRRVGRRLGAWSAGEAGDDLEARVAAAAALLESIGGSLEVLREPDGWLIRARGCPLSAIVAEDPDVCALAESLVAEATGRPAVESCDRSVRPRCAFRIPDEGV